MFNKKVLSLFALSLLVISLFSFVVSAQSLADDLFSNVKSVAGTDFLESLDNVSNTDFFKKAILMFIVVMIIYSISPFIPFVGEKKGVAFMISLAIGYLSIAYLVRDEVEAALFSYNALGITLTLIIPFVIIGVLAKRANQSGNALFSKLLWMTFLIILVVRYFTANPKLEGFAMFIFPVLGAGSLIMIAIEKKIWRIFAKAKLNAVVNNVVDGSKVKLLTQISDLEGEIALLVSNGTRADDIDITWRRRTIKQLQDLIAKG